MGMDSLSPDALPSVLVVDDYPDAAEFLALLLSTFGFPARAAVSREQALATDQTPDIVLLEPRLRGQDGYGLVEVFSSRGVKKVIALTTGGRPQDYARSKAAGVCAHLLKPAHVTDVLAAIRAATGRASPVPPGRPA
jgi:DNA-binding response OmpR family regulator